MAANLAQSEMLKQENPMDECAGEQVEKTGVRWIYSLFADHDTGNIHKQLDGELKEGIPRANGICLGRVTNVPICSISALGRWKLNLTILVKLAVGGVKTPIKRIDRFSMIIKPKRVKD